MAKRKNERYFLERHRRILAEERFVLLSDLKPQFVQSVQEAEKGKFKKIDKISNLFR